jgi:ubiquinone/menaquinone biosynthesis C-methylase UbiE
MSADRLCRVLGTLLTSLLVVACSAGSAPPAEEAYTTRPPSRDGTGRVYMGREIAQVMSHHGAPWLDRPERLDEERPDMLLARLGLERNDVVVDFGAGSGYLTVALARTIPGGRVLAVDIQPEMLELVRAKADGLGLANVETVLATPTDPRLPADVVDLVLMVDVYHELYWPAEVMAGVVRSLAPDGRVALVEYRAGDPSVPIKPLHTMTEAQARAEMAAVGLEWVETLDALPRQHLMFFRLPPGGR